MDPVQNLVDAMADVEAARRLYHWRLARLRVLVATHGLGSLPFHGRKQILDEAPEVGSEGARVGNRDV